MERSDASSSKVTTTFKLNGQDVIKAMRSLGFDVPDRAKVFFVVPGGADWSNAKLDITDEEPLFVSFTNTLEGG